MYGLLALCAAGVFFATRADDEPEQVVLTGRTARGHAIKLVLYGGKLHSFTTRAAVRCPVQRVWRSWIWTPTDAGSGFRQDGLRFHVRQRAEFPDARPPAVQVGVLRGTLTDEGKSARGTIEGRWLWGGYVCEATVPFSARRSP